MTTHAERCRSDAGADAAENASGKDDHREPHVEEEDPDAG
jgi:hypothetical protein